MKLPNWIARMFPGPAAAADPAPETMREAAGANVDPDDENWRKLTGDADRAWACFLALNASSGGAAPSAGATVESPKDTYDPQSFADRQRRGLLQNRAYRPFFRRG